MMHWELILFFFTIALFYSSVGFGGGSSYLALLAFYEFDHLQLRIIALLCNIIVVAGGVYIYTRGGHLKWKKVLPLVIVSVPLAFLGGRMRLSESYFFILLGITLTCAAIAMWVQSMRTKDVVSNSSGNTTAKTIVNSSLGGGIGFLSGLVGIGGGIFLAPVFHLMSWDSPKVIAATASFFILVNSVSGIIGQLSHPDFPVDWTTASFLMASVFAGGQLGSRISAQRFNPNLIRRMTAILIFFVGCRILLKYLG